MVGSINDCVLETTGVLEVQVDLAVLAAVGRDGSGTNVCLELVEAISDYLLGYERRALYHTNSEILE